MFRVFRTLGLALGLLGGVVAAQAPEFAQQYAQRLGGAADELRRQVAVLESDAQASGTTRDGGGVVVVAFDYSLFFFFPESFKNPFFRLFLNSL